MSVAADLLAQNECREFDGVCNRVQPRKLPAKLSRTVDELGTLLSPLTAKQPTPPPSHLLSGSICSAPYVIAAVVAVRSLLVDVVLSLIDQSIRLLCHYAL